MYEVVMQNFLNNPYMYNSIVIRVVILLLAVLELLIITEYDRQVIVDIIRTLLKCRLFSFLALFIVYLKKFCIF